MWLQSGELETQIEKDSISTNWEADTEAQGTEEGSVKR